MKKEKAAVPQAAAKNNESQSISYPNETSVSTTKVEVGELLLFGNTEQKGFWRLFDAKLRQFYDLNLGRQNYGSIP